MIKISINGGYNMLRRPRRLRSSKAIRNLVRETKLQVEDFIYPLFIVDGECIKKRNIINGRCLSFFS